MSAANAAAKAASTSSASGLAYAAWTPQIIGRFVHM